MLKRLLRLATTAGLIAAVSLPLLSGCGEPRQTLTVLAGSELKDIKPYLEEIADETGVELHFQFTGTLDGAETLASGAQYDLGWFSHAKYLNLLQDSGNKRLIHASERIMLSPVILGVKNSTAERFGWCAGGTAKSVSWADIAAKAATGEFRFAMSNPAASNSGFSVAVAAQVAFNGEALSIENVDAQQMRDFARGHVLRSGSSGWLADLYLRDQAKVDGIFNYESVLLTLNQDRALNEKLCLIYPSEGIVTADYPLLLLNKDKREAFDKLVAFFKTEGFQRKLMDTGRRPSTGLAADNRFPKALLLEAPFPASVEIVDAILTTYLDKQLTAGHAIFVVDVSGSMQGQPISELRKALLGLTGLDRSITGQFSRFRAGERVTVIPFSSKIKGVREFTPSPEDDYSRKALREFINDLQAGGGTAIFSALQKAYSEADNIRRDHPDRPVTIVLMSDGLTRSGIDEQQFSAWYRRNQRDIPTFTVVFGKADSDQMKRVAHLTGGRSFDSRKHGLQHVFKKIRGYQ